MADITMTSTMSRRLLEVTERAKRDVPARLRGLSRHIDTAALTREFHGLSRSAAVGVDGVAKDELEQHPKSNIRDLHERLKLSRYRHQPIRCVHIPKDKKKPRPLGISSTDDKVVEQALREVLEVIYEQDFLNCSYRYRPAVGAHNALGTIDRAAMRGEVNLVLEADVRFFFDSWSAPKLMEMLRLRVDDAHQLVDAGDCSPDSPEITHRETRVPRCVGRLIPSCHHLRSRRLYRM